MRIQYNGKSKILIRLAELVNQKADAEDLEQTAADLQKEIDEKADKSAIPTVGDGVLSVQRNGKSVGTFSANAAKDTAINIPIPKKVSELENDAGYGTYTKLSTGIPKSDLASGVQASLGKADTALQKHQDISGKQDKLTAGANITISGNTISAKDTTYGNASASAAGKSVGTFSANAAKDTGINIPIPKKVSELENDAGYGTYTKLSTGIPKSDLASGVQASLGKADTALQKHQDISGKQDKLTAGANITISGNTISAKDTTYGNASASAAGLMSAADKKKLDGMGLSKYLPLAGGTMAGDIDMATNQKDIVVGTHRSSTSELPTAVAGGTVSRKLSIETGLPKRKSLIGSWLDQNSVWHNIISVRHRNGYGDGVNYGFYLRSLLTSEGNLAWNK